MIAYGIPALIAGATIGSTLPFHSNQEKQYGENYNQFSGKILQSPKNEIKQKLFEKLDHHLLHTYHSSEQAKSPQCIGSASYDCVMVEKNTLSSIKFISAVINFNFRAVDLCSTSVRTNLKHCC